MTAASRRARQQVLERWPGTYCIQYQKRGPWFVYPMDLSVHGHIGSGPTRAAAWQDAAKKLEGEGK